MATLSLWLLHFSHSWWNKINISLPLLNAVYAKENTFPSEQSKYNVLLFCKLQPSVYTMLQRYTDSNGVGDLK